MRLRSYLCSDGIDIWRLASCQAVRYYKKNAISALVLFDFMVVYRVKHLAFSSPATLVRSVAVEVDRH